MGIEIVIYLISSMGIIISLCIIANCINSYYEYTKYKKFIVSGAFLGIGSVLFNSYYLQIGSSPVFDCKFLLILILANYYDYRVFLTFAPFFLLGVYFSPFSIFFAISLYIVSFIVAYLGKEKRLNYFLSFSIIITIAFSEIPIMNYISEYDGKLILTASIFISFFIAYLGILLFDMVGKRFRVTAFLETFSEIIFSKHDKIFVFKIDKTLEKVYLSERLVNYFELQDSKLSFLDFTEILKKSSYSMLEPINNTVNKTTFITQVTQRELFIEYSCFEKLFGGYVGFLNDVTSQTPRHEILYHQTQRDFITGFPTYLSIKEDVLDFAKKSIGKMLFTIIEVYPEQQRKTVFDVEFEIVCFKYFAHTISATFPDAIFFAVKSGEFIMALSNIDDSTEMNEYAIKIRAFFDNPHIVNGKKILFTAKLGFCHAYTGEISDFTAVSIILQKLFFCKTKLLEQKVGKNYWFVEDEYLDYGVIQNRVRFLPQIFEKMDINLMFQPVISFQTGDILYYEVLLRINNNIYVNTTDFVSDCIYEGLDVELDIMVFKKLYQLLLEGKHIANLAINMLANTPIVHEILGISKILNENGKTLYIEITEQLEYTKEMIRSRVLEARKCGAKLVADDYGMHFSNLELLYAANFDAIKIPREFVTNIHKSNRKQIFAKNIVDYCKATGSICICEGIETKEEADFIKGLSVDYGQGYYFKKPMDDVE